MSKCQSCTFFITWVYLWHSIKNIIYWVISKDTWQNVKNKSTEHAWVDTWHNGCLWFTYRCMIITLPKTQLSCLFHRKSGKISHINLLTPIRVHLCNDLYLLSVFTDKYIMLAKILSYLTKVYIFCHNGSQKHYKLSWASLSQAISVKLDSEKEYPGISGYISCPKCQMTWHTQCSTA